MDLRADLEGKPPPTRQGWFAWLWEIISSWGPPLLIVLVIRSSLFEPFQIPSGSMVPTLAIGDFILVSKSIYGLRIPFTTIEILPRDEPDRGDIVVFLYPPTEKPSAVEDLRQMFGSIAPLRNVLGDVLRGEDDPQRIDYIKRIVGLPGDEIEVRDDVVYLNGAAQTRTRVGDYEYVDAGAGCRPEEMLHVKEALGDVSHDVLQVKSEMFRFRDFGPVTVPSDHYFVMGDNRDNSADSRVWGFVPRQNIKGKANFVWLSFDWCQGDIPVLGSIRFERIGHSLYD